ncbi:MAG: T9SS type A sorting domain-containing protein [Bacteroidetes bacterium]|nr:T9SS type A sorting domain-containing protein [Bacteroidota bacterium]
MIKQLLTMVAIGGFAIMNAQSGKTTKPLTMASFPVNMSNEKISAAPGCQTVSVINPTTSVSLYTIPSNTAAGCSPNAGYVFGNNCYGYLEQATFFPASTYSSITGPSITAVSVGFYRNPTTFRGTKGTTGTVGMSIYAGTSPTVMPGASITTTNATLANVVAAQTGTLSLFIYTFTMSPTTIPATGFYASLVLPTTSAAGDTAVIYTQTASSSPVSPVNGAWGNDGTGWFAVSADWGINVNHVMTPVVCGSNIITGLSTNTGLSKKITLSPNPTSGVFNVGFNFNTKENVTINVTNALGQIIKTTTRDMVSNENVQLDLSAYANGVYFVTVSNGTDKMVQRLILNK